MIGEIRIVFDGPPSHESGRFIEVENAWGQGIGIGQWHERDDGFWELRIGSVELGLSTEQHAAPTPGPYELDVSCGGVLHIHAPNHGCIAVIYCGGQNPDRNAKQRANARLFAASWETARERDRLVAVNERLVYACQILVRLVGLKVLGDTPSEVKFARAVLDEVHKP